MKEVQIAGGTSETEDYYVGAEREIRIDTSNDEIRIHDGSTPGGKRVPNKDTNDTLYQGASPELDGFDFSAQGKGFVARVGPANYKLRTLKVNENQLSVSNPKGTLGDPTIGLLPTISTDHTWTGLHTFTEVVTAEGGVIGNVQGDTQGTHYGDVEGNVTGNLVGDTIGTHTGDVDVRGSSLLLDDGQIDPSKITDLVNFIKDNCIEVGMMMMWSGTIDSIPARWALCDGNNGTPDLTDKFVIGAGDTYAVGAFGGAVSHNHAATVAAAGAHTHSAESGEHTLTVDEIPSHHHQMIATAGGTQVPFNSTADTDSPIMADYDTGGDAKYSLRGRLGATGDRAGTSQVGGGQPHSHSGGTTSENGSHTHSITVDGNSNLPPYYALAFIMKVA